MKYQGDKRCDCMMCNLCFSSVKNVGRTLVAVRRATARLVIKHIHANDTLKYDLKNVLFLSNAARGSASWRRAVAPLVIKHVFVNEYSSMIYNF